MQPVHIIDLSNLHKYNLLKQREKIKVKFFSKIKKITIQLNIFQKEPLENNSKGT